MPIHRSHRHGRSLGRNHLSDSVSVNSVFSAASVLIPIRCSTFNFQLWIEDPDPVGTVNLLCAALPRATEHTGPCHPRGRQCYHQSETRDIPL